MTTHTIFCVRERVEDTAQWFLCGMFNSFVANYLVRLRGGTHVTAATMDLLRVPRPAPGDRDFMAIAALTRQLTRDAADSHAYVQLQAHAARLYGLSQDDFDHVLGTFPLVPADVRADCSTTFRTSA